MDDRIEVVGSTDDDLLIIDYSNGNPIPAGGIDFDGSGQAAGDSILVRNGAVDQVTHTFTAANGGSIVVDPNGLIGFAGDTITYTGLELTVDDQMTATDRVMTVGVASQTVTLSDATVAGQTQVNVTTGLGVTFNNPTNSIALNTQAGADTISIRGVDSAFNAALNINGDVADMVSFDTNATDIGSGNLTITGLSVSIDQDVDTTGTASVTAGTTLTVGVTGSLSANGAIDIDAGTDVTISGDISGGANVDIDAGDDVDLQDNSSVAATGTLVINADVNASAGASINLAGDMNGSSVTVNGGGFADSITLGDVNGTVENVLANLTINAGTGNDSLTIDDSGDASGDASIVLTNSSITGLVDGGGNDQHQRNCQPYCNPGKQ